MFKRFPFIHNHGDFVHLDALRDWFRGVVSLESFLKSKDDKAIIKDMHFTDERTTVDYIDTKDDTEKTETLCEYLTSDVFDETNSTQFNKVDKISFIKNENGERRINVREKNNKKQRLSVILSNIPVAYDANTNTYNGTSKAHHIGVSENGVKIYNDETLQAIKEYDFKNIPIAYNATDDFNSSDKTFHIGITENGVNIYNDDTLELVKAYNFKSGGSSVGFVNDTPLDDCNPFGGCSNLATHSPINFTKTSAFFATKINNTVVSGQVMYRFIDEISVSAGKSVTLQFTPATMGSSNFSRNVYPKYARCHADNMDNNAGVITSLHYDTQGGFPTENTLPIRLTVFNPNETDIRLDTVLFTF